MSRRNTSTLTDAEIFAELRALFERIGHIPVSADFNRNRDFPLNATGMRRRFGNPGRAALLAGIWFAQGDPAYHDPIDIEELLGRYKELFESEDMQTLYLGGIANPERLLVSNVDQGLPVGGMATTIQAPDAALFPIFIQASSWRVLEATESARAHLVIGVLLQPNGEPYRVDGEMVPATMLVTYDLHEPHGLYFDGRFVLPRSFHLNTYIRACLQPVPA